MYKDSISHEIGVNRWMDGRADHQKTAPLWPVGVVRHKNTTN